jgi:hypothetical protein
MLVRSLALALLSFWARPVTSKLTPDHLQRVVESVRAVHPPHCILCIPLKPVVHADSTAPNAFHFSPIRRSRFAKPVHTSIGVFYLDDTSLAEWYLQVVFLWRQRLCSECRDGADAINLTCIRIEHQ